MLGKFHLAVGGLRTAFSMLSEPLELANTQLKAERKLEQVFKATGNAAGFAADEIEKFASERQGVTNFGDEVTLQGAAVLATFKQIKGQNFKDAIVSAQDMAETLEGDLQSSILMVGKALNDPARGLSALSRAGVQFTASQTEAIKKLQESGQVAEAQQIILRELQSQFGGVAEKVADPLKQASNSWGDFLEEVGKGVRGLAEEILKEFDLGSIQEGAREMVDFFNSEWKDDVVQGVKDAAVAGKELWEVFKDIGEALGPVVEQLREMDSIVKEFSGGRSGLLKALANPTGAVADLMAGDSVPTVEDERNFAKFNAGVSKDLAGSDSAIENAEKRIGVGLEKFGPDSGMSDLQKMMAGFDDGLIKVDAAEIQKKVAAIAPDVLADYEKTMPSFIEKLQEEREAKESEVAEPPTNQVRSLEAQSSEAFDVLRNMTGVGKPEEKQLKESQKTNKKLDKLIKAVEKKSDTGTIEERGFD